MQEELAPLLVQADGRDRKRSPRSALRLHQQRLARNRPALAGEACAGAARVADERPVLVHGRHRLPAGAPDHRLGGQAGEQLGLVVPGTDDQIAVESEDRVAGTRPSAWSSRVCTLADRAPARIGPVPRSAFGELLSSSRISTTAEFDGRGVRTGLVHTPSHARRRMNTLIIYDSLYGNTELLARAIGAVTGTGGSRWEPTSPSSAPSASSSSVHRLREATDTGEQDPSRLPSLDGARCHV